MNAEVEDYQPPFDHKAQEEPSGISAVEHEMEDLEKFFAGETMSPEAADAVRQMINRITDLETSRSPRFSKGFRR